MVLNRCKFCNKDYEESACCDNCGFELICFKAEMAFYCSITLELNDIRQILDDIKSDLKEINAFKDKQLIKFYKGTTA
jgi:hypothetical protein